MQFMRENNVIAEKCGICERSHVSNIGWLWVQNIALQHFVTWYIIDKRHKNNNKRESKEKLFPYPLRLPPFSLHSPSIRARIDVPSDTNRNAFEWMNNFFPGQRLCVCNVHQQCSKELRIKTKINSFIARPIENDMCTHKHIDRFQGDAKRKKMIPCHTYIVYTRHHIRRCCANIIHPHPDKCVDYKCAPHSRIKYLKWS